LERCRATGHYDEGGGLMNKPQNVTAFDLETIPDVDGARRVLNLPDATDAEVHDALQKKKTGTGNSKRTRCTRSL
jgi:hypothetical protein